MHRFLSRSLAATVCLLGVVAVPTASSATSLGYTITRLTHPTSVRTGASYQVTGRLVDAGGQPVADSEVFIAAVEPAKSCTPASCLGTASPDSTDADGNFSLDAQSTLDTAFEVYPVDDSFQPDTTNAIGFAVTVHNAYTWSGPTHFTTRTLQTSPISLSKKRTRAADATGASVPLTQVSRDNGKHWRTLTKGANSGALFNATGYRVATPILGASRPGHYLVRVLDHGGKYEAPAKSRVISVHVTKRRTPSWLARTNHYRHSIGLQNVFESKAFDKADRAHAKWMARNGILCHCETKDAQGYTKRGDKAGQNSVIELGKGTPVGAVDLWMGAPFHATCLLNPAWSVGGFGVHANAAAEWCLPSKQVLDLAAAHGAIQTGARRSQTFPSKHMKVPTSLLSNLGESPDPRTTCKGHWSSWTVPVLFRVAHPPAGDPQLKHATAKLTRNGRRVGPECAFSGSTFRGDDPISQQLVREILTGGPWVILLVKPHLQRGATYRAKLTDGHYTQATTFTVAR